MGPAAVTACPGIGRQADIVRMVSFRDLGVDDARLFKPGIVEHDHLIQNDVFPEKGQVKRQAVRILKGDRRYDVLAADTLYDIGEFSRLDRHLHILVIDKAVAERLIPLGERPKMQEIVQTIVREFSGHRATTHSAFSGADIDAAKPYGFGK